MKREWMMREKEKNINLFFELEGQTKVCENACLSSETHI